MRRWRSGCGNCGLRLRLRPNRGCVPRTILDFQHDLDTEKGRHAPPTGLKRSSVIKVTKFRCRFPRMLSSLVNTPEIYFFLCQVKLGVSV